MSEHQVRLRAVARDDLAMLRRFSVEPGLVGPNWSGFRDAGEHERRFATDGFLGAEDGRLIVDIEDTAAGLVSWRAVGPGAGRYWNIGIVLLPQWRGRGAGWRAQAMLCDYLFTHSPVPRIEAGTQPENIAEQKALERAGFQREGVLRSAEFRLGQWRDIWIYGRLRADPAPAAAFET